ncbi:hypothetical protein VTO73DRAFT_2742 [Trametes versicolor]
MAKKPNKKNQKQNEKGKAQDDKSEEQSENGKGPVKKDRKPNVGHKSRIPEKLAEAKDKGLISHWGDDTRGTSWNVRTQHDVRATEEQRAPAIRVDHVGFGAGSTSNIDAPPPAPRISVSPLPPDDSGDDVQMTGSSSSMTAPSEQQFVAEPRTAVSGASPEPFDPEQREWAAGSTPVHQHPLFPPENPPPSSSFDAPSAQEYATSSGPYANSANTYFSSPSDHGSIAPGPGPLQRFPDIHRIGSSRNQQHPQPTPAPRMSGTMAEDALSGSPSYTTDAPFFAAEDAAANISARYDDSSMSSSHMYGMTGGYGMAGGSGEGHPLTTAQRTTRRISIRARQAPYPNPRTANNATDSYFSHPGPSGSNTSYVTPAEASPPSSSLLFAPTYSTLAHALDESRVAPSHAPAPSAAPASRAEDSDWYDSAVYSEDQTGGSSSREGTAEQVSSDEDDLTLTAEWLELYLMQELSGEHWRFDDTPH